MDDRLKIKYDYFATAHELMSEHFMKHCKNGNLDKAFENNGRELPITFKVTLKQIEEKMSVQVDTTFTKSKVKDRDTRRVDPDQPELWDAPPTPGTVVNANFDAGEGES